MCILVDMAKTHGNTGRRNALQGDGADDHIHIRFNGKLKQRGQKAAKKANLSFSKWIESLFTQELDKRGKGE